jgi:hypothetical protein
MTSPNLFFAFHIFELCESVLALPFDRLRPLKEISGIGLQGRGGFLTSDVASQFEGTASLRA